MHAADQKHGTGRRAGHEAALQIARRKLTGIEDVQPVEGFFRQDGLDDQFAVQMFRQGQLHEYAVDGLVSIQTLHERCELFLRGLRRQGMLDRIEAALRRHAAFRADIGVA